MKYIALLRGINVGGIRVAMADLRECLDYHGVKTYLNTGNVVFESTKPATDLRSEIENKLSERFKYEAYALIYPLDELKSMVADCPFETDEQKNNYLLFCDDTLVLDDLLGLPFDQSKENIAGGNGCIYWQPVKERTTKSVFGRAISSQKYKLHTTNRNINTLEKILKDNLL